jgi:hypothetical protein
VITTDSESPTSLMVSTTSSCGVWQVALIAPWESAEGLAAQGRPKDDRQRNDSWPDRRSVSRLQWCGRDYRAGETRLPTKDRSADLHQVRRNRPHSKILKRRRTGTQKRSGCWGLTCDVREGNCNDCEPGSFSSSVMNMKIPSSRPCKSPLEPSHGPNLVASAKQAHGRWALRLRPQRTDHCSRGRSAHG